MEETALKHLKRIFSDPSKNILSLEEAYLSAGLDLTKPHYNRMWIANRLTTLKKFKYVEPIYARRNNTQVLEKILLTELGRRAMLLSNNINFVKNYKNTEADIKVNQNGTKNPSNVSIEEILKLLLKYSEENPKHKISYSFKDEVISVQQVRE